jgi:ribA/ribD-fused uncharacterized protein
MNQATNKLPGNVKPDNDTQIFFYEQEFYPFSNFSSFQIRYLDPNTNRVLVFQTSEHLYHWRKFPHYPVIQQMIMDAPSAHEAFQIAQRNKEFRLPEWKDFADSIMDEILELKVQQHEYVHRKLKQSVGRELIEDSWRDGEWGWGPDAKGKNRLGKRWMALRDRLFPTTNKQ